MLKSLEITNYALLDHVQVNFQNGLIILTGETGAGKSIFIDAMGAILGDKVDQSVVRHGADKAIVEAIFSTEESQEVQILLKELELADDSENLILRREIWQNGRTRAFANDTPINQATLTQIGNFLVDLHGQHEHQSLLVVSQHLKFLDQFGHLTELVQDFAVNYQEILQIRHQLNLALEKATNLAEKKSRLEFQLAEINQVNPQPDEETELQKEEKILQNSEKLYQVTNAVYRLLYEDKNSAGDLLSEAATQLSSISQIDERLINLTRESEACVISVREIAKELQNYLTAFEFNPERLEEIRQRLAVLSGLKKKYGGTLAAVIQYREKLLAEVNSCLNIDQEINQLKTIFDEKRQEISKKSLEISKKRLQASKKLKALIESNLAELGMEQAQFEIQVRQELDPEGLANFQNQFFKTTRNGIDLVEFFLAANPGSPAKPLVRVASGGEISRVMLALKLAQADTDRLPVMVFDEIDNGVSGRIAQAVGRNLQKLSQAHQILCITHLPQIASMGCDHLLVEKFSDGQQTHTTIRRLEMPERVMAVARLLGGDKISETHLQSAQELIQEAQAS